MDYYTVFQIPTEVKVCYLYSSYYCCMVKVGLIFKS